MSLSELKVPKWRKLYEVAVLETDPKLVKRRAIAAEEAAELRLNELDSSVDSHEEKAALARSLQGLKCLKETDWAV
jgi:hypothetical protein